MNKGKFFLTILFSIILVLNSCFNTAVPEAPQEPLIKEAVIIHWNDFHSANLPYQPTYRNQEGISVGGYANLAGYIDSLKGIYPVAVTLNAGDDFQGSPVSSLTKGMSQILILNEIMPSAFTIGNHEFDYGVENLKQCVDKAKFSIISSNIYNEETGELLTKPYVFVNSGDVRIAVIGILLEELKGSVLPENVKNIEIFNPYEQVKKYVAEVNDQADLIVVLSHQGFFADSVLATKLDEVDVIVGGHSHSWLYNPVKVNNILVCQAGARGERLGLLKAKVDVEKNTILSYDYEFIRTICGKVKSSKSVEKVVDSLELHIKAEMDNVIGKLESDWLRSSRGESNIGDWIADATRAEFQADICFQNSGGIRKGLRAGDIKVRDIWEISPFDNTIMIIEISGAQLKEALQWRIDNPRDFLQVSGLCYKYNNSSKELLNATVNGLPIDDSKIYTLATNNYIVGHCQRFLGIKSEDLKVKPTGIIGRDILIKAVKEQGVIKTIIDGRIVDVGD